jgi:hypothetical protein
VEAADQDLVAVYEQLATATGDLRGCLRVTDALLLAGFDRPTPYRRRLITQAFRKLGWERARYRFDGVLTYVYARGTRLERETLLYVEIGAREEAP